MEIFPASTRGDNNSHNKMMMMMKMMKMMMMKMMKMMMMKMMMMMMMTPQLTVLICGGVMFRVSVAESIVDRFAAVLIERGRVREI